MTTFDLKQTILDECKKYHFSSDIKQLFIVLKGNELVINALKNKSNEFQNSGNNLLYDLILYTYLSQGKFFVPTFKYEINSLIFDKNIPRLCLNLHSNFSPLTSILIKQNYPFVVVSDYPNNVKQIALNSGIRSGHIRVISRDETCLLNAKNFFNKNYLVSSTIDFRDKIPGRFNMLSDSMLRLAKMESPYISFGINLVNDYGELIYITISLNADSKVEELKKDIIEFLYQNKANARFQFGKFNYIEYRNLLHSMSSPKII